MAKKAKIDLYHLDLFGNFLDRLRSTPDGDGTLLDHSMFVYGSGMSKRQPAHARQPADPAGRAGAPGRLEGRSPHRR
jgi:hypothetical protein